jgi:imidazole glycerol-phosphate synthase subunit HisF
MLRQRLITVLTLNNGVLFRTKNFHPDLRYTLSFVDAWSIDEIVVLDITRPGEGDRQNFYDVVSDLARKCFVPLAAGGGVSSIEDIRILLKVGADKVVINTAALKNPNLVSEAAKLFGAQCIIVSIDAKRSANQDYEVFTSFGTEPSGLHPSKWAKRAQELGAGEILITSIEKDGSLEGYDNELNRQVSESVDVPVLVSGGAGKWQDFVDGFTVGKASGVCTTNIYHFTESSIKSAKKYLQNAGVVVRI